MPWLEEQGHAPLAWPVLGAIAQATSRLGLDGGLAETISCGPSTEKHLAAVGKYVKAGFDHIVLVQVGPDQEYFLDLFQRELAPAPRKSAQRPRLTTRRPDRGRSLIGGLLG